jgi:hypothetical protein
VKPRVSGAAGGNVEKRRFSAALIHLKNYQGFSPCRPL